MLASVRLVLMSAVFVLLVAAGGATASPTGRPKTMSSYCSPSGDICYAVANRSGAVYFELSAAAKYFARYRLCRRAVVTGAAGAWRCAGYPLVRRGSTWGSQVKFRGRIPTGGANYRVEWSYGGPPTQHTGGTRLGPALRFHLPQKG
jgi:hypothetical protein